MVVSDLDLFVNVYFSMSINFHFHVPESANEEMKGWSQRLNTSNDTKAAAKWTNVSSQAPQPTAVKNKMTLLKHDI